MQILSVFINKNLKLYNSVILKQTMAFFSPHFASKTYTKNEGYQKQGGGGATCPWSPYGTRLVDLVSFWFSNG